MRGCFVTLSYQRRLCWQRQWPSWRLRAAWLWTSWSRGCGRWLWRSFLKHGPACLCHRASPQGSRWWFPQALCQRAKHYQCSAELWDKGWEDKLQTSIWKQCHLSNSSVRVSLEADWRQVIKKCNRNTRQQISRCCTAQKQIIALWLHPRILLLFSRMLIFA